MKAITFRFANINNGDTKDIDFSYSEIMEYLSDYAYEKLVDCKCEPIGESYVVECSCDDIMDEYRIKEVF